VPAPAYAALIFYLSSLPNPLPMLTSHLWDKGLHATEYGGLAALLVLGIERAFRMGPVRAGVWAACLASLYGASDEFHQAFVPHRSSEVADWLADTTGAALGALLAVVILRRWRARASIDA
jgi:VanZ family protein